MTIKGIILVTFVVLWLLETRSTVAWYSRSPYLGKVRLRDVQVLTLRAGKMTTGRRSQPIPQLNCVGGTAEGQYAPSIVQCYNQGSDGVDVHWECKANMDNSYKFGSIEIICEGYDYPDDPYITRGSCGLEYTIDYTDDHERSSTKQHEFLFSTKTSPQPALKTFTKFLFDLILLFFFGVLMSILCVSLIFLFAELFATGPLANNQRMRNRRHSMPNVIHPDVTPGPDVGGFWTGMATGGLLGYITGNRWNETRYRIQPTYRSVEISDSNNSPSSGTRMSSEFGVTRRR